MGLWKIKNDFQVIPRAKLSFQVFNPAVMTSEGQTVEPFEASHKHKNFDGKFKIPNFEKDDG